MTATLSVQWNFNRFLYYTFILFGRQEMIQLKRKVDELSTVRKTVDHLAQEINIERKEISQFKKTVQDHSLEIKKFEDSFSSRITFLEELMQSIDDRKIKVARTSDAVQVGDNIAKLQKLEQLTRIYGM